jgi:hypothetical protein
MKKFAETVTLLNFAGESAGTAAAVTGIHCPHPNPVIAPYSGP